MVRSLIPKWNINYFPFFCLIFLAIIMICSVIQLLLPAMHIRHHLEEIGNGDYDVTEKKTVFFKYLSDTTTERILVNEFLSFIQDSSKSSSSRTRVIYFVANDLEVWVRSIFTDEERLVLMQLGDSTNHQLQRGLLSLCAEIGGASEIKFLERIASSSKSDSSAYAINAMTRTSSIDHKFLYSIAEKSSSENFEAALIAIVDYPDENTLEELIKLVTHKTSQTDRELIFSYILALRDTRVPQKLNECRFFSANHFPKLYNSLKTKKEKYSYNSWWKTVEHDIHANPKIASEFLTDISGVNLGENKASWLEWWESGNRPVYSDGRLDSYLIRSLVDHPERYYLFAYQELRNAWIDWGDVKSGIDSYQELYADTSIDLVIRIDAAGAALRLGDSKAGEFLISSIGDNPISIYYLRRTLRDNYFSDKTNWQILLNKKLSK